MIFATNFPNLKLAYDPEWCAMTATFEGTPDEIRKIIHLCETGSPHGIGLDDFELTTVSCWGYGTFRTGPWRGLDSRFFDPEIVYFGYDPDKKTWRLTIPHTYPQDDLDGTITPVETEVVQSHWIAAAPVLKQFASYLAA